MTTGLLTPGIQPVDTKYDELWCPCTVWTAAVTVWLWCTTTVTTLSVQRRIHTFPLALTGAATLLCHQTVLCTLYSVCSQDRTQQGPDRGGRRELVSELTFPVRSCSCDNTPVG